jgi:hypothetical protein
MASLVPQVSGRGRPDPDQIRRKVARLPIGGAVTVDFLDGATRAGRIHSIEPDSFSIREVDLRRTVTIRYDQVRRITKGIAGRGFGGRRVNPRTNRIAGLAILGGLLGLLIFAVVALKKS